MKINLEINILPLEDYKKNAQAHFDKQVKQRVEKSINAWLMQQKEQLDLPEELRDSIKNIRLSLFSYINVEEVKDIKNCELSYEIKDQDIIFELTSDLAKEKFFTYLKSSSQPSIASISARDPYLHYDYFAITRSDFEQLMKQPNIFSKVYETFKEDSSNKETHIIQKYTHFYQCVWDEINVLKAQVETFNQNQYHSELIGIKVNIKIANLKPDEPNITITSALDVNSPRPVLSGHSLANLLKEYAEVLPARKIIPLANDNYQIWDVSNVLQDYLNLIDEKAILNKLNEDLIQLTKKISAKPPQPSPAYKTNVSSLSIFSSPKSEPEFEEMDQQFKRVLGTNSDEIESCLNNLNIRFKNPLNVNGLERLFRDNKLFSLSVFPKRISAPKEDIKKITELLRKQPDGLLATNTPVEYKF